MTGLSRPARRIEILVVLSLLFVGCHAKSSTTTNTTAHQGASKGSTSNATGAGWSFEDATESLGVAVNYDNGEEAERNTILESLGGGAGVFDYDRDGREDLVFPGGGGFVPGSDQLVGKPTTLLRGNANAPFQAVTESAGLGASTFYSHGVAIADVDNDGFADLLVTGYGGLQFWRNEGDGTFRETAQAAGLTDASWSTSAALGDLNNDGNVDLYIAHYVDWSFTNNPACAATAQGKADICPPRQFQALDDIVYFSEGDGHFRDGTKEAGLVAGGKGLGVMMADFDQDHDLDIYVANDTDNNFLYWNDGQGHLKEDGILSGTAVDDRGIPNGSMGLAVADYDGDQRFDIFVANYEDEAFALYRQVAPRQFLHVSQETGITSLGALNVGFGSAMFDIEADGDPDVVVTNGHIMHFPRSAPVAQKVMLLENRQRQRFERVDPKSPDYLANSAGHIGRGLAIGDLDGDGRPDMVFANNNQRAAVLLNKTVDVGQRIRLRLIGRNSNRDGIGSIVTLVAGKTKELHCISGGGSYLSASHYDIWLTAPSGSDKFEVEIQWPSGFRQKMSYNLASLEVPRTITILEPFAEK